MNKKIDKMKTRIFFSIICILAVISACEEGVPGKLEYEEFKKIYLSAAGEEATTITLPSTRDTSFVFGLVAYGGTTYYGQGNIEVELVADFSLVETFNAENNTQYEALPKEHFAFDRTKFVIENGGNYSARAQLFLVPEGLDTEKTYLLPATIRLLSGDVPINEERKTAYWVISFDDLPVDFEKETWEVISYSSQWSEGMKAANVIDGEASTAWHSEPFDGSLNGMPQWIIIDMKKTRKINGFTIWLRQDDHGGDPKNMVFELSDDGTNWTTFIDVAELSNDWTVEIDVPASAPQSGRYLRTTIKSNWGGLDWSYYAEITPY